MKKTIDFVPAVWYDIYNEREQQTGAGEKLLDDRFPSDRLSQGLRFILLGERFQIKKEGEVRWQVKSHSCICCLSRILRQRYRHKSVARSQLDWLRARKKWWDAVRRDVPMYDVSNCLRHKICYWNWQHMIFSNSVRWRYWISDMKQTCLYHSMLRKNQLTILRWFPWSELLIFRVILWWRVSPMETA